jgi:hypothetical protein
MDLLHYRNIELFLPGDPKPEMEPRIHSHTDGGNHGSIPVVTYYKRPVRSYGHRLFIRLLAAGHIMY